jgi:hypothetical protein
VYWLPLVLPAESDVLQVAVPTFVSLEFRRTTEAVQSVALVKRSTKVTVAF